MATHSSVLAWRTPGTGEPGGLLSMGSHRVGHDWSDLAALFYFGKSSGRITIITYKYMTHCKEIQPVNPKGNQPWIFIGRTDVEAKAPIFWPRDDRWPTGKYPDAGKDRRQEKKEATEDEMVGWHHWLNGHEFEQIPVGTEGHGSRACCSPLCLRVRYDLATGQQQYDTSQFPCVFFPIASLNRVYNFCGLYYLHFTEAVTEDMSLSESLQFIEQQVGLKVARPFGFSTFALPIIPRFPVSYQ